MASNSGSTKKDHLKFVPDDPEQFQRFVEAARELGADTPEAVEMTERALRRMLPPRDPGKTGGAAGGRAEAEEDLHGGRKAHRRTA